MRLEGRSWLLRVALFLLLLGASSWPWPVLQTGFSRMLSALANPALGTLQVGNGGRIELVPLEHPAERTAEQNVREDTHVVLRVPGQPGEGRVGISLRRDAYLPLAIFVAAVAVLPVRRRAKACALALGSALIISVAVASVAIMVVYLASRAPGTGIPNWQASLSSFLFDCWLTPPGNRVIAPLLLAAASWLALRRRAPLSAAEASPAAAAPYAGATS
jgi:hypothetical protein